MKSTKMFWHYAFALITAVLILFSSCKKDEEKNVPIYGDGVTDIDGNEYITVIIGGQEWMAENLKTTKYNDGTPIPTGHTNSEWTALTTGAYAVYPHAHIVGLNSDAEVLEAYGALYNWYTVNTGNLCPTGWRVPNDAEWSQLIKYIDPAANPLNEPESEIAGGKLKSTRSAPDTHPRWLSPNEGSSDEYGFSALPGGGRDGGGTFGYGTFLDVGNRGFWWSSTQLGAPDAWIRSMYDDYGAVLRFGSNKRNGVSVRCLRDN